MAPQEPEQLDDRIPKRVIKRYSNRKLYDTEGSRYVTLLQVADLVRAGEEVQIIDNATKEDKTETTLALIISEELKAKPRGIPVSTLKALIRNRGEKLLTTLRDGPIGRLMPREGEELDAEGNWHPSGDTPEGSADSTGGSRLLVEDPLTPEPVSSETAGEEEQQPGRAKSDTAVDGVGVSTEAQAGAHPNHGLAAEIEALRETLGQMHDRLVALERHLPPRK